MIQGIVTRQREVVVRLNVRGPNEERTYLDAVDDTGFNDYLILPAPVVTQLQLPFEAPTEAVLADGSVVDLNYFQVAVEWDGEQRDVLALSADSDPLIGMRLLEGFDVFIEAIEGGAVRITKRD